MENILPYWFTIAFNIFRYIVISGTAFLIFYIMWPNFFARNKIQSRYAKRKDFFRELFYSVQTMAVFIGCSMLFLNTPLKQYTRIYNQVHEHHIWWIPLSILLSIVVHDTYFYWMHRIIHHPSLYRKFHVVHHQSYNPSPLASYAFNLSEAIAESLIIPILLFTIPMHPYALITFTLFAFSFNVYGHLGYEIAPKWFRKSVFFECMVTSVHHNLHHSKFKGNYGYYFRFWDRIMGTENPDYVKTYDSVQQKRFGTRSLTVTAKATFLFILFPFLNATAPSGESDSIHGIWKDDVGKAIISIYETDGIYYGKLIDVEDEEDRRELQQKEILVLRDFKKESKNNYCCGTVYQPKHDRILTGHLFLKDKNTLIINIRYGVIKRTRAWHRVE